MKVNLLSMDRAGLTDYFSGLGEKPFRATQAFRWLHQHGVTSIQQMSELSKTLREKLEITSEIPTLQVLRQSTAQDGVVKWLFDAGAGNAFETVFIPESDRATLCISSQVGCAVNCAFCSTGHQGFARNLSADEIIGQVRHAEFSLRSPGAERVISNVVLMGMGEPLLNYAPLLTSLRTLLDDHGYGLSRRRVTVSTSGVVPFIERLALDCPVALAVSLHAPDDELRDQLVPLNRKYPLRQLLAACDAYLQYAPRDFITFEYCLLKDVNDSPQHAKRLFSLLKDTRAKVNLIPFNPFPGGRFEKSHPASITRFAELLRDSGLVTTIRKTRGDDIDAACGQLAGEVQNRLSRAPVIESYARLPRAAPLIF